MLAVSKRAVCAHLSSTSAHTFATYAAITALPTQPANRPTPPHPHRIRLCGSGSLLLVLLSSDATKPGHFCGNASNNCVRARVWMYVHIRWNGTPWNLRVVAAAAAVRVRHCPPAAIIHVVPCTGKIYGFNIILRRVRQADQTLHNTYACRWRRTEQHSAPNIGRRQLMCVCVCVCMFAKVLPDCATPSARC